MTVVEVALRKIYCLSQSISMNKRTILSLIFFIEKKMFLSLFGDIFFFFIENARFLTELNCLELDGKSKLTDNFRKAPKYNYL